MGGSRKRIEDRKNMDYSSLKMVEKKDNIGKRNAMGSLIRSSIKKSLWGFSK